jgi:hypothetical protein
MTNVESQMTNGFDIHVSSFVIDYSSFVISPCLCGRFPVVEFAMRPCFRWGCAPLVPPYRVSISENQCSFVVSGLLNYAQQRHPELRTWRLGAEARACEHAPYESRGKRIMHIGFLPKLGKISGAQHRAKIGCPLAVAEIGRPAFLVFAYAPPTDYERAHNLTLCPIRT